MPTDSGVFRDDTDTPVGGRIIRAYRRDTGALIGSAVSSDGLAIPGDPYLSDRVLLIRGGGASIADECPTPRTIAVNGNAGIVTADSTFDGQAIQFDGSGDFLTLDGHSSLAFGSGDFSIEMRIQPGSVTGDKMLIDFRPNGGNGAYPCLYLNGSSIAYYVSSVERISASHGMSAMTGYNVAICRKAGVTRLFINSVQVGSSYTDSTVYLNGAGRPAIGANGFNTSSSNFSGLIGKIRLSRRADLDASFTPINQPFYTTAPIAATPLGSYSITHSHTGERQFVFLDDAGGTTYNDKIVRVV